MSLLSRLLSRSPKTQHPARRPQPRLGVQQLEAREVPAVDFASALGLGNDTSASGANDVAVDAAGNSYMTGSFTGTLDFDPAGTRVGDTDILTSAGDRDIFVAKYAPDDTLVWAVRMGGAGYDVGWSLDINASGNVHVTGQFNGGTATFGSVALTSVGLGNDGFVAKLNTAGAVQWANRWGETDQPTAGHGLGDKGLGVDTDAAGNVYVVGSRSTTGVSTSTWGNDVLKYSPGGSLVSGWPKSINTGGWGNENADLVADAGGNVYLTGGKDQGRVDFNPHKSKVHYVTSSFGTFVLKLTSSGDFAWVGCMAAPSGSTNSGGSLTLDGNGNVIFGGYYLTTSTLSYATSSVPNVIQTVNMPTTSNRGGFIAKLNGNGVLTWASGITNTSPLAATYVRDLATDAAGNVYATGSFNGTIDLDPGAGTLLRQSVPHVNGSGPSDDVFVVKLTSAGNFAWGETFGGDGTDFGHGIAVDTAGTIHFAGGFSGTVDFDPDPLDTHNLTNTAAVRHMFLVRLRQN